MSFWHVVIGACCTLVLSTTVLYIAGAFEPYEREDEAFSAKARRGLRHLARRRLAKKSGDDPFTDQR